MCSICVGLTVSDIQYLFLTSSVCIWCAEITTACQEPPFAALCAKYGAPTGLVVTNKDVIPITRMYLKARTDSIVIAIANATCSCEYLSPFLIGLVAKQAVPWQLFP